MRSTIRRIRRVGAAFLKMLLARSEAKAGDLGYLDRVRREIRTYRNVEKVANLPEIHGYWANRYVLPLLERFEFRNGEEFYFKYVTMHLRTIGDKQARVITLGSGNCEFEVELARGLVAAGFNNFIVECTDINPFMLIRGKELASRNGVLAHMQFSELDVNAWDPAQQYDIVIANHSLHHFVALEQVFAAIRRCLVAEGYFLTHDMIGRNGHMRWPEALEMVNKFWSELPDRYKYNNLLQRSEPQYINFDCSTDGFEGIRSQDILPLLIQNFQFELFIPFGNVIDIFVDRCFGHNFDAKSPWDQAFIDRVAQADQLAIEQGHIKPTHMIAALKLTSSTVKRWHLSPEFCVRQV